jgi:glycosyltransferase involved in cell wall biosynthesis
VGAAASGIRPLRVRSAIDKDHGSSFYRIWVPFAVLGGMGWNVRWVYEPEFTYGVIAEADVLVLPRAGMPPDELARLCQQTSGQGTALVFETDDDIWNVEPANPAFDPTGQRGELARNVLRVCHAATCTNRHLAARLKEEAGWDIPVTILPNCVYLPVWEGVDQVRRDPRLTIGVHGGPSHGADWEVLGDAWALIAERYPEVQFTTVGYCPPSIAGRVPVSRLKVVNWVPVEEYPQAVAQMDISCIPLRDVTFNRSKSNIKLMESALGGAASIVSETVYGPEARANQMAEVIPLARDRDPEAWAQAIGKLIEEPELRRTQTARAVAWVKAERDIVKGIGLWDNAYRQALARVRS